MRSDGIQGSGMPSSFTAATHTPLPRWVIRYRGEFSGMSAFGNVGVRRNVLDGDVCFDFWSDELMDAYRNCKRVIDYARLEPEGTQFTYDDLEQLNEVWVQRHKKMVKPR